MLLVEARGGWCVRIVVQGTGVQKGLLCSFGQAGNVTQLVPFFWATPSQAQAVRRLSKVCVCGGSA